MIQDEMEMEKNNKRRNNGGKNDRRRNGDERNSMGRNNDDEVI
jgi:hypothetical protein